MKRRFPQNAVKPIRMVYYGVKKLPVIRPYPAKVWPGFPDKIRKRFRNEQLLAFSNHCSDLTTSFLIPYVWRN
jgi:hypothetical protein